MAVGSSVLAVLTIVSSTYGDFTSEPMPAKVCHEKLHEVGAQFDRFAKYLESQIPTDLKQEEYLIRIDEIWNFKAHCEPLKRRT